MKKLVAIMVLLSFAGSACTPGKTEMADNGIQPNAILNKQGKTLVQRFSPPDGYRREPFADNSFAAYLRGLELKPDGAPVLYYNGAEKPNDHIYAAVVNMDIGNKDLQQCADAVIRLRAEYLYEAKQYDKIHFNFTSGFRADYSRWAAGNRIVFNAGKAAWRGSVAERANYDYAVFRSYLETVFSYAGTLSLSRELRPVPYSDLQPGDVLIQGGSPGHAVIVADVAVNRMGQKVYLLAQSYMPAQETQILHNPANAAISPWYELDKNATQVVTPQWLFTVKDLKRFEE
jgi:hypothetical protein